ncbi:MAG: serine/threonine protein kinase [Muribaculaceae bacterium]|nr:serine/threonine protein kinase [Muribaculaceae bacterium]
MDIIFNEYYNLRSLGKGSFASVFKAKHIELGYIRAVKVSKDIVTGEDDKAWQTFLKECKLLLKIGNGSHPNIVRIYQPRRIGNNALVEMDYIEGETLHRYIEQNDLFLPMHEVNRFAHDIVSAMAYCHVDLYKFLMDPVEDNLEPDPRDGKKYLVSPEKEKQLIEKYGVIHNDLHSGNIMRRDYDGAYILLDFGLAKQDGHFVKSSSRNDGSREYCPPEKFDGKKLTAAADVYSLGILMFEALAGDVPFKAPDSGSPESKASALENAHKYSPIPSILTLRKAAFERANPGLQYVQDYPQELELIIRKCLAKNPEERYQNAKELQQALLNIPAPTSIGNNERTRRLQQQVQILSEKLARLQDRDKQLHAGGPMTDKQAAAQKQALHKADSRRRGWKRLSFFLITLVCIFGGASILWHLGIIQYMPAKVQQYANVENTDTIIKPEVETIHHTVHDTIVQRDTVRVEVPVSKPEVVGPIPDPHIIENVNNFLNEYL